MNERLMVGSGNTDSGVGMERTEFHLLVLWWTLSALGLAGASWSVQLLSATWQAQAAAVDAVVHAATHTIATATTGGENR